MTTSSRLENALRSAYAADLPADLGRGLDSRIAAAMERARPWSAPRRPEAVGESRATRQRFKLARPVRVSIAISLFALLAMVVAVTAIGQLFPPGYYEPGGYMWKHAQVLGLSQSVNGYRVTLDSVYADVNQLAVAVTVQDPGKQNDGGVDPAVKVTDSAGVVWQMTTGGVDPSGTGTKATMQYVPATASAVVPAGPRDFTFEVEGTRGRQGSQPVEAIFTTEFTASIDVRDGTLLSQPASASAAGVTVTLDRMVIAPSTVEVDLHWSGLTPPPAGDAWAPYVEVRHDGVALDDFMGSGDLVTGAFVDWTAEGADSAVGHWTITVSQLWYDPHKTDDAAAEPSRVVVNGPWVFELDVP